MRDEVAFHAAIRAEAADSANAVRLVYADWLDEQGHAERAEYLRLWVRAWSLPAGTDELWTLKPRLAALRPGNDEWLRGVGCDGHIPVFRHIPEDWRGRWRLVRAFVERWHGITMPDVGRVCGVVRDLEALLSRSLSPSVREWCAFADDLVDQWDRVSPHWQWDGVVETDGSDLRSIATSVLSTEDLYLAADSRALDDPKVFPGDSFGCHVLRRPPRYRRMLDNRLSTWAIRLVLEGASDMAEGDGFVVFDADVLPLAQVLDGVAESRSVFGWHRPEANLPREYESLVEVVWEGPHFFAHAVEDSRLAVSIRPWAPAGLLDIFRPHSRAGASWGVMAPPGAPTRPYRRHTRLEDLP